MQHYVHFTWKFLHHILPLQTEYWSWLQNFRKTFQAECGEQSFQNVFHCYKIQRKKKKSPPTAWYVDFSHLLKNNRWWGQNAEYKILKQFQAYKTIITTVVVLLLNAATSSNNISNINAAIT